jgi:hypothetical protein
MEGARGAWDVPENRIAGTRKVDNTGPPPGAVEDGITGNRGGYRVHAPGDGNGEDKGKDKEDVDHISALQAFVHDGTIHDASVKVQAPAPAAAAAPVTPSKPTEGKEKDTRADRGYHPAELHPYTPKTSGTTSNPTSPFFDRSPSSSLREKHGHVHHRTVSNASHESGSMRRKKVGFFDKVRGEAKVIVGKIEHKKEKVEEGKRILHGED